MAHALPPTADIRQPATASIRGKDESLVARMRAEYLEMPGLCLTPEQACRLWSLDAEVCQRALEGLVAAGFLKTSSRRTYIRKSNAA